MTRCSACGLDLTPTPAQLRALERWGNPLRRPPCLETVDGHHRLDRLPGPTLTRDEVLGIFGLVEDDLASVDDGYHAACVAAAAERDRFLELLHEHAVELCRQLTNETSLPPGVTFTFE